MFKPKFTINNKINNFLLEIERARGFLEAAKLKEQWIKYMQSEVSFCGRNPTKIQFGQKNRST